MLADARMRRFAWIGLVVLAACSVGDVQTESTHAAIQGGMNDGTAHPYALGLCVGGKGNCGGLCSGALLAPNLALTARHCVQSTPQTIDCATSTFGGQSASTSSFWFTTNNYLFQNTTGWHQAKSITVPAGNLVCGNDIALVILTDNVSPNEAVPTPPLVWGLMTDHKKYSTSHTAIGFGNNGASGSGTRRIRQDMLIQCIPGDKVVPCSGSVNVNEFVSDDGVCSGDSGSSAYEQLSFNKNTPITFGVASRAGFSNGTCVGSIYQRTDSHTNLIVQTAISAAQQGGYAAPPWTVQPPPPPMDAGVDAAPDASMGGTKTIGAMCATDGECATPLVCKQGICTQPCAVSDPICPDPLTCETIADGDFCLPKKPPPPVDAGAPPPAPSGGCNTSGSAPSWSLVLILGALGALLRRRCD